MSDPQVLIDKIKTLSAERVAEVEDFIDFLRSREQGAALVKAASAASSPAFAVVWENQEDDVYDAL